MGIFNRIDRFFAGVEWKLSLGTFMWGIIFPAGSFALPAWGASAIGTWSAFAPLSWIASGFLGLFLYATAIALIGFGRWRSVRARYDANFMRETGGIDPMSKVFENKRIFLNDFVLPSNPHIEGKTFVDCEIVGPANVYLQYGNGIDSPRDIIVDAVALNGESKFQNGFSFRNCRFRSCTFHRVTLFFHPNEVSEIKGLVWLNWISPMPPQDELPGLNLAVDEGSAASANPLNCETQA